MKLMTQKKSKNNLKKINSQQGQKLLLLMVLLGVGAMPRPGTGQAYAESQTPRNWQGHGAGAGGRRRRGGGVGGRRGDEGTPLVAVGGRWAGSRGCVGWAQGPG